MTTSSSLSCLFSHTAITLENIRLQSQEILNDLVSHLSKIITNNSQPLKSMTVDELVSLAEQIQIEMANKYQLSDVSVRKLDANRISQLLMAIKNDAGKGQFFFRHGEQFPCDKVSQLKSSALKKIIMMQPGHNEYDPITPLSAIEFISSLLVIAYLRANTDAFFSVESSPNLRAKQPATTLAALLGITPQISEIWRCVNYQNDLPEEKKAILIDGTLPWNERAVDAIVEFGAYKKIICEMQEEVESLATNPKIKITFTHTQQIQAVSQLLGLESKSGVKCHRTVQIII